MNQPPANLHRWRWNALAVWTVLVTVVMVYGLWENRRRVEEIQQSRIELTRAACEDQNDRNEGTKNIVNHILDQRVRTASPTEIRQLRASRSFTFLVIDAVIPKKDCAELVRERFP